MTGFSAKVRALILQRDEGCVICGTQHGVLQVHHRAPRGMGGAKATWVNQPSNGITVCAEDHRRIEANRAWAESHGYIVRRGIQLPRMVPVLYRGVLRWLTDQGHVIDVGPEPDF